MWDLWPARGGGDQEARSFFPPQSLIIKRGESGSYSKKRKNFPLLERGKVKYIAWQKVSFTFLLI